MVSKEQGFFRALRKPTDCGPCACLVAALLTLDASAAHAAGNVWSRLEPVVRLELLLALLGLILVGLAMFVMIRLSASFARRRMRQKRTRSRLGPDNWAARRFLKRRTTHEPRGEPPRSD